MSYQEIANGEGISRERVRQILIRSFGGSLPQEIAKSHFRSRGKGREIKVRCAYCKKTMSLTPSKLKVKRTTTCDKVCSRMLRYGRIEKQSADEVKEKNRINARIYYMMNKNKPEFKEKVRRANFRALLKARGYE